MEKLTEEKAQEIFENFLNSFQNLVLKLEGYKESFSNIQNDFYAKYQKTLSMLNKLYDAFKRMDEKNKKLALLNFINLLETQKITMNIFENVMVDDTSHLDEYKKYLNELSDLLLPYLEEFHTKNKI
jgi:conjugal transfer/entry exclusion protein